MLKVPVRLCSLMILAFSAVQVWLDFEIWIRGAGYVQELNGFRWNFWFSIGPFVPGLLGILATWRGVYIVATVMAAITVFANVVLLIFSSASVVDSINKIEACSYIDEPYYYNYTTYTGHYQDTNITWANVTFVGNPSYFEELYACGIQSCVCVAPYRQCIEFPYYLSGYCATIISELVPMVKAALTMQGLGVGALLLQITLCSIALCCPGFGRRHAGAINANAVVVVPVPTAEIQMNDYVHHKQAEEEMQALNASSSAVDI